MNIKKVESYDLGLDLGTGSDGWALVDDKGDLCHIKGQPAWGSRLFPSAQSAADTRIKRGQRRRYARRRQRIETLQSFFLEEMEVVDPEFFVRLRQSRLFLDDASIETHALFGGTSTDDDYKKFPTIWHVRKYLMESDDKADIRFIYLALHNIVKYRGNFLQEDNKNLRAKNANAHQAAIDLAEALRTYFEVHIDAEELAPSCSPDASMIQQALDEKNLSKNDRAERLASAFDLSDSKVAKQIAKACTGLKVEFSNVFFGLEKQEGTSIYIYDDEKVEDFLSLCPDEAQLLFQAMRAAHSSLVLSELLCGKDSLSSALIDSYEQHKSDLRLAKGLIKDYFDLDTYRHFFRGPKTKDGRYDINKVAAGSYTSYILGEKLANKCGTSHEDLLKSLKKLFESNPAVIADERYQAIQNRLMPESGDFLAKQKTRSNGAIPMQLHLEEMERIIEKQGKYYPFLQENQERLKKIVSSRIPYYVGPLNASPDPYAPFVSNVVDPSRKFAWSCRKPGMEHAKAYPWNVEEVVDTDKTAELFIRRMTGTCTYLHGQPVLPRCSLLYEEFCVLNELNGARWAEGDKDAHRFDQADREALIKELFEAHKGISHAMIAEWLERHSGVQDAVVSGTQAKNAFESKLGSYNDFCAILEVRRLEDPNNPLSIQDIEQIILWSTVFEDRSIFKRKLVQEYGDLLSEEQIKKIVRKRYTGWGRLSRKFLCEIRIDTPLGRMGIMDIMREGDPTTGHHLQAMNLMEVIRDKGFGFEDLIDRENHKYFEDTGSLITADDLQGSPALRRSVNQAITIIDELIKVAGKEPRRIVIEVTRDDDQKKKGKRTTKRFDKLQEALQVYNADAELMQELKAHKDDLSNEKLMLYFAQGAKSLYSGKPLYIEHLNEYHVDHILPQCYIKDDSLDNKALVLREENERKLDTLLLDPVLIHRQSGWWKALHQAGLISDKKLISLTRTSISEKTLSGFINRQLVETSQMVKLVRQMCEQRYPGVEIVSLRASLTHGLRDRCDFAKSREMNDYHHAHDAYLGCEMARFIGYRYPKWQDGFDLAMIRKYVKGLGQEFGASGRNLPGKSGFIVDSFLRDGFDRKTGEIFKDTWDAELEISRMRKTLNYKQCYVTRMTEEQTGAFWDETVYSPHDSKYGKNLSVPLKNSGVEGYLDPQKYGGVRSEKYAYFFVFIATDEENRQKCFFEGVPLHLLSQIARSSETLQKYAEQIASAARCHDARILRSKVPLRQRFLLDGCEFYLCGRSNASNEIRSAREYAGSLLVAGQTKALMKDTDSLTDQEYAALYRSLRDAIEKTCPILSQSLDLKFREDSFMGVDNLARAKIIQGILKVINGDSQGCDLSDIGGKASTGYMIKNIASCLDRITWIDESVTGIFRKYTTFKDMIDGL